MEEEVSVWKSNLTNGLILGLIGIVYTLVLYFLDMSTNKSLGYVFFLIQIVVLFFLVKSYRDNYMHGMITYGQALGAGVIICLIYAVIMAVFSYILYAFIDTGLIDKLIAISEEAGLKRGLTQEQIDMSMKVTRKLMTPVFISIMAIISNMFFGTIFSLIIAIFVKKEGNPLIDSPEVK
jgi:Protein of unknown function (DUF4199)